MSFPPPPAHHVRTVPPGPPAAIYRPPPHGSNGSSGTGGSGGGRRWGLRLGLVGGLLAITAGGLLAARAHYLPGGTVLPGLAVDGERVAEKASEATLRAMVETRARHLAERKVRVMLPASDKPALETSLAELGVKVDVDATVATALRVGKSGDLLGRAQAAREARAGKIDVPLRYTVDRAVALPVFESLKDTVDTQAVSARLDLDKHATIPERDGRYLDSDGAVTALEAQIPQSPGDLMLAAPVVSFPPRVSSAFLKSLAIDTVVAEYETFFSRGGDQRKRGKNIDNAAQKLDGLVISPGEMVSFNAIVGERSESNGFQKSWEIFKGEMVEGVGGGTCQVASTFHAVAFFGGFDVLERLPHSRPSAYIPMGLDSTVVYPGVDLKVRNPHPFPVVVHAKTEGSKLRVELLGKMRPVQVSFGRELVSTLPYKRKIVEEASLSGKKVLVKQHGIKGFRVKRSRMLKYPDGTSRKEETTDLYPPTTEIYHVPVGFDVALLPSLPGGEGEDADLGANPSATPSAAKAPASSATATGGATASAAPAASSAEAVEFVDAPGAHAPNSAQANPTRSVVIRR